MGEQVITKPCATWPRAHRRQLINQALDEMLTEQEGEVDADTRWALAWFERWLATWPIASTRFVSAKARRGRP
jgi:hypothetical protein